jgi:predicted HicB family RNase H-like nuclease
MGKKPAEEVRSAPFNAKIRPRFKRWAEAMARADDRSLAQWTETMIQAEHDRREAKSQRAAARKPSP